MALALAEKFITADPKAAAKFFESLSTHEALQFLSSLKAEQITVCLENMAPQRAAPVLRRLPAKQAAHIAAKFNINFAAQVLNLIPQYHQEKIKALLPKTLKDNLDAALQYPKGSVGLVMENDFLSMKTDSKIADIITKLKNMPRKKVPQVIFILDKNSKLLGLIRTLDLVFYSPAALAGSVMTVEFDKVTPETEIKEANKKLKESDSAILPVVNDKNIMTAVYIQKQKLQKEEKKGIISKFFNF